MAAVGRTAWPPIEKLTIEVHPHVGVDVAATVAAFPQVQSVCHVPARTLPLDPFSVKMPSGNRFLVASLEILSDTEAIVAWEGRTYPYRQRFDAMDIPREADSDLRVLAETKRNLEDGTTTAFILRVFGAGVLRNLLVNVRVLGEVVPSDGSVAADLLTALGQQPNIYLDAF